MRGAAMQRAAMLALAVLAAAGDANPPVVQREPGAGSLAPGQRVLVDDGTCPAGQIKLVVGGSNISDRTGAKPGGPRVRSCVPRG